LLKQAETALAGQKAQHKLDLKGLTPIPDEFEPVGVGIARVHTQGSAKDTNRMICKTPLS